MQGLFGWIGNHSVGLFADEAEAIEDADQPQEKAVEDQYMHPSGIFLSHPFLFSGMPPVLPCSPISPSAPLHLLSPNLQSLAAVFSLQEHFYISGVGVFAFVIMIKPC